MYLNYCYLFFIIRILPGGSIMSNGVVKYSPLLYRTSKVEQPVKNLGTMKIISKEPFIISLELLNETDSQVKGLNINKSKKPKIKGRSKRQVQPINQDVHGPNREKRCKLSKEYLKKKKVQRRKKLDRMLQGFLREKPTYAPQKSRKPKVNPSADESEAEKSKKSGEEKRERPEVKPSLSVQTTPKPTAAVQDFKPTKKKKNPWLNSPVFALKNVPEVNPYRYRLLPKDKPATFESDGNDDPDFGRIKSTMKSKIDQLTDMLQREVKENSFKKKAQGKTDFLSKIIRQKTKTENDFEDEKKKAEEKIDRLTNILSSEPGTNENEIPDQDNAGVLKKIHFLNKVLDSSQEMRVRRRRDVDGRRKLSDVLQVLLDKAREMEERVESRPSQNQERYQIRTWIDNLKNRRAKPRMSRRKHADHHDCYYCRKCGQHMEESWRHPGASWPTPDADEESEIPKSDVNSYDERGGSAEDESESWENEKDEDDNVEAADSAVLESLRNEFLRINRESKAVNDSEFFTDDLQLYRDRAKTILKNAEDILREIQEREERLGETKQSGKSERENSEDWSDDEVEMSPRWETEDYLTSLDTTVTSTSAENNWTQDGSVIEKNENKVQTSPVGLNLTIKDVNAEIAKSEERITPVGKLYKTESQENLAYENINNQVEGKEAVSSNPVKPDETESTPLLILNPVEMSESHSREGHVVAGYPTMDRRKMKETQSAHSIQTGLAEDTSELHSSEAREDAGYLNMNRRRTKEKPLAQSIQTDLVENTPEMRSSEAREDAKYPSITNLGKMKETQSAHSIQTGLAENTSELHSSEAREDAGYLNMNRRKTKEKPLAQSIQTDLVENTPEMRSSEAREDAKYPSITNLGKMKETQSAHSIQVDLVENTPELHSSESQVKSIRQPEPISDKDNESTYVMTETDSKVPLEIAPHVDDDHLTTVKDDKHTKGSHKEDRVVENDTDTLEVLKDEGIRKDETDKDVGVVSNERTDETNSDRRHEWIGHAQKIQSSSGIQFQNRLSEDTVRSKTDETDMTSKKQNEEPIVNVPDITSNSEDDDESAQSIAPRSEQTTRPPAYKISDLKRIAPIRGLFKMPKGELASSNKNWQRRKPNDTDTVRHTENLQIKVQDDSTLPVLMEDELNRNRPEDISGDSQNSGSEVNRAKKHDVTSGHEKHKQAIVSNQGRRGNTEAKKKMLELLKAKYRFPEKKAKEENVPFTLKQVEKPDKEPEKNQPCECKKYIEELRKNPKLQAILAGQDKSEGSENADAKNIRKNADSSEEVGAPKTIFDVIQRRIPVLKPETLNASSPRTRTSKTISENVQQLKNAYRDRQAKRKSKSEAHDPELNYGDSDREGTPILPDYNKKHPASRHDSHRTPEWYYGNSDEDYDSKQFDERRQGEISPPVRTSYTSRNEAPNGFQNLAPGQTENVELVQDPGEIRSGNEPMISNNRHWPNDPNGHTTEAERTNDDGLGHSKPQDELSNENAGGSFQGSNRNGHLFMKAITNGRPTMVDVNEGGFWVPNDDSTQRPERINENRNSQAPGYDEPFVDPLEGGYGNGPQSHQGINGRVSPDLHRINNKNENGRLPEGFSNGMNLPVKGHSGPSFENFYPEEMNSAFSDKWNADADQLARAYAFGPKGANNNHMPMQNFKTAHPNSQTELNQNEYPGLRSGQDPFYTDGNENTDQHFANSRLINPAGRVNQNRYTPERAQQETSANQPPNSVVQYLQNPSGRGLPGSYTQAIGGATQESTPMDDLLKNFEDGNWDSVDLEAVQNMNKEDFKNLLQKVTDNQERSNCQSQLRQSQVECDCAESSNPNTERDKYKILKDFLLWVKDVHLNRVFFE